MPRRALMLSVAGLLAVFAAHTSCANSPAMVMDASATMSVFANPQAIPADGGVSVISVSIIEHVGTTVPDGTVVQFLTSLGQIEPSAKTKNGVARVNLVSDSRSGEAQITVISGVLRNTDVKVGIGGFLPKRVLLVASPDQIGANGSSRLTATVLDKDGNPVANIPVVFTTGPVPTPLPTPTPTPTPTPIPTPTPTPTPSPSPSPTPTPSPSPTPTAFASWVTALDTVSLDSAGRTLYTDTNGQVFDILRARVGGLGRVTVRASAAGLVTGSADVWVN
jgi:cell division septation protein DedD